MIVGSRPECRFVVCLSVEYLLAISLDDGCSRYMLASDQIDEHLQPEQKQEKQNK
jgi:hypothetical protein